jgi:hypothetical protein
MTINKNYKEDSILKTVFGKTFTEDLNIIFKNKDFKLRNMVNYSTIFQDYSEYNHKNYKSSSKFFLESFLNKFNPIKKTETGIKRNNTNSNIIYINGMMTNEDMALYQLDYLQSLLEQKVELVYNHTEGFFKDIIECSIDRHEHAVTEATINTVEIIKEKLKNEDQLFIIGHSQGAIIATSALKILQNVLSDFELNKIKYITFGAGFKNSDLSDSIYSEHYANCGDPIVHLGLLNPESVIKGSVYKRDVHGHMFIADYLYPMSQGEFSDNGLFYRLISD